MPPSRRKGNGQSSDEQPPDRDSYERRCRELGIPPEQENYSDFCRRNGIPPDDAARPAPKKRRPPRAANRPPAEKAPTANGVPAADGGQEALGLGTTCLATIRPEPVRWLVPGYLPLGKLVLLAGDGGHGKTSLTLDLAACLTTGRPWCGSAPASLPPSGVLLVSCEDDYADTVVPRLLSAGADLRRIFRIDGVRTGEGKLAPFSLGHYQDIEAELQARPDVRLVVIDPAGAYVGRSGVDDYNDSELRTLLGPLAELAAKYRVTIILVKHLVKGATAKAVHKVSGSAGYVNTVRAAFVVAPDSEDAEKKLLLPLKFNLGRHPKGLAYRMAALDASEQARVLDNYGGHLDPQDRERLAGQLFRVEWSGTVDTDADHVLGEQTRRERSPGKVEQAGEWLLKFLEKYAYPSEEIIAAGRAAGFTKDNLWRAKANLSDKICASNRGAFQGKWHWGPGDPGTWTLRPTPWKPSPETPESPETGQNTAENGRIPPVSGDSGVSGGREEGPTPQDILHLFP